MGIIDRKGVKSTMNRIVKRLWCVLLSVLLPASTVPFMAGADGTPFENTHINTGDGAVDIVAVARTQIGYHEGALDGISTLNDDYTKYGVWFDEENGATWFSYAPWCAMFVSWCAAQADVPSSVMPYHAGCGVGLDAFVEMGAFEFSAARGGDYVPKAGDIIYYGDYESPYHVGLVADVRDGRVYTIEGNTSKEAVSEHNYSLDYTEICGYGIPPYTTAGQTTATPLGTYRIHADLLNVRSEPSTAGEIVGALWYDDIVTTDAITEDGWGRVTLADGAEGWCSIVAYGHYIGMDMLALSRQGSMLYREAVDSDGRVTIINRSADEALTVTTTLPFAIGTATTPYVAVSITGSGWQWGLSSSVSGESVWYDEESGTMAAEQPLGSNTASAAIEAWLPAVWQSASEAQIDTVTLILDPQAAVTLDYGYFTTRAGRVVDTTYNQVTTDKTVLMTSPYTQTDTLLADIAPDTTVQELLDNLTSDYTITLTSGGEAVASDGYAATAMVLSVTNGERELLALTLAVRGDINGDGGMNTADVRTMLQGVVTQEELGEAVTVAADVDTDGNVSTYDARKLLQEICE